METRASHVLIGSFVLAVLVLGMLFVLWLGKLSLDREWDEYRIDFRESVTGLSIGGAVQYNGIQIGDVRRLRLSPDDPSVVQAFVRVAADTPIKTDTRARLTFTGLTGVVIIELTGGSPDAALLDGNGDELAIIQSQPSALTKLLASGEDIVTNVNSLMLRLSGLFSEENLVRVSATLAHLESLTASAAPHGDELGQAIADLSEASRLLRSTLQRAEPLMAQLESIAGHTDALMSHEAREMIVSARASLEAARTLANNANTLLDANAGALDQLGQQGLPQIGPTLHELRNTLAQLQSTLSALEQDPARYLIGADQAREVEP
ncbi:MAG: MCE family protein [Aquimonas sp.]|jgi:phospholipid/cholesterol/gamma-HCH transport system substrate-binding protein|nr:MCE family protein [Xanthomonadales bacterium]MCC6506162.1 MCE family protein [Aquimonas sp.]